jgi:hypothetical protein
MSKKRAYNIAIGEEELEELDEPSGAGAVQQPGANPGDLAEELFENDLLTPNVVELISQASSFWKEAEELELSSIFSSDEEDGREFLNTTDGGVTSTGKGSLKTTKKRKGKRPALRLRTEKTIGRGLLPRDFKGFFKRGLRITLQLDSILLRDKLWERLVDDLRVIGMLKGCGTVVSTEPGAIEDGTVDVYPLAFTSHCDDGELYKPLLKHLPVLFLVRLSILRLIGSRLRQRLKRASSLEPVVLSQDEIYKSIVFFQENFTLDSPGERETPKPEDVQLKHSFSKRIRIDMTDFGSRLLKLSTWQPTVPRVYAPAVLLTCKSLLKRAKAMPKVVLAENEWGLCKTCELELFKISSRKLVDLYATNVAPSDQVFELANFPWVSERDTKERETEHRPISCIRRNLIQMLRSNVGLCAMFCAEQFWGTGNIVKNKFDKIEEFMSAAENWRKCGTEQKTKTKVSACISRAAPNVLPDNKSAREDRKPPLFPVKNKGGMEGKQKIENGGMESVPGMLSGMDIDAEEVAYQKAVYKSVMANQRITMLLATAVLAVFRFQNHQGKGGIRSDTLMNILAMITGYCWLKWCEERCYYKYGRTQLARIILVLGCGSTFLFHYNAEHKNMLAVSNAFVAFRTLLGFFCSYQFSILAPRKYAYVFHAVTIVGYFFVPSNCFAMGQPFAWAIVSIGHLCGDTSAALVLQNERKKCRAVLNPLDLKKAEVCRDETLDVIGCVNKLLLACILCTSFAYALALLPSSFEDLSALLAVQCCMLTVEYVIFRYWRARLAANFDGFSLAYSRCMIAVPIIRFIAYFWLNCIHLPATLYLTMYAFLEAAGAFVHSSFPIMKVKYRHVYMALAVLGAVALEQGELAPQHFAGTVFMANGVGEILGIWIHHICTKKHIYVHTPIPIPL